ncbi:MAG: hypothetical protein EAZ53_00020 [Bacteroidetes bacterium]|nr:MAG: hypothetical protein EAZ53_00020 [Bacteroidota bacterium]
MFLILINAILDSQLNPGILNIDFKDIEMIFRDKKHFYYGIGEAKGINRTEIATQLALDKMKEMDYPTHCLVIIYANEEFSMDEYAYVIDYISNTFSENIIIKCGISTDNSLSESIKIVVTVG